MKFRPVPGAYGVEDVTILDEAGRVTSGGLHDGSMVAAAGLIHDLGNLIQIAYSAINILARAPDMPAPRSGPILHRARSCLEHAGALVRQNIEVVRDRAIPGECSDVATCLSEVAALVIAMDEPGLILETDIEPRLPDLRCDPIGLRRVLLNLVFNARDTAENLKKSGAFIPGIRPGQQTAEYIDKVLTRLTLWGAVYVAAVCLLPEILAARSGVPFHFGGTSLLICVVVVMDFMSQLQAHMMSHHYPGLLKKANLLGYGRTTGSGA